MKSIFILLLIPLSSLSQTADTLNGFGMKMAGEEINYFSPLHQFARTALLTRANGSMPISWESPSYKGGGDMAVYEFLLGHSTGTSSGERHFDLSLNGEPLFTIVTPKKKKGKYTLKDAGKEGSAYQFITEEYDANGDAFGKLYITLPSRLVNDKAIFTITGQNENSQDWLMIFMYKKGLKILVQPTNLVTVKERNRQVNIFADNPYPTNSILEITAHRNHFETVIQPGYNKIDLAAYPADFTGVDTIQFIVKGDTLSETVALKPVRPFVFAIIHHSHNDIGYSHVQREVEKIQDRNIRAAIQWINNNRSSSEKPVWHIESLWAVENFLNDCTAKEEKEFVAAVKSGQLVLSANYANILTGICQQEELNWVFEYAKKLEKKYGIRISNGMITDIPGISYSGLLAYANNDIPYLSLGPNYVESLPDKGDRVGAVIRQQGDKVFYWKPSPHSTRKLLVWTAGKGYSFFHGIADSEKEQAWEKRISDYCNELTEENYPYDLIQLRYTKNSDNGPVDTLLNDFVEKWNEKYLSPKLRISSVNDLFKEFEVKYGQSIPVKSGEISPYWEDGAYSSAVEEMQNRQLAIQTIEMEKFARSKGKLTSLRNKFYRLHRDIVMFHEHTWGSWSSISDPESAFTATQWMIKKEFVDSAQSYYDQLAKELNFHYKASQSKAPGPPAISDYSVDVNHGGLVEIIRGGKNIVSQTSEYKFFEPVYATGINPMRFVQDEKLSMSVRENSALRKIVEVNCSLPSIPSCKITYTLWKKEGRLVCHYEFNKMREKDKESLHVALPFAFVNPGLEYGNDEHKIVFGQDQLPGSNKDFICVESALDVVSPDQRIELRSPLIPLYEVGDIIDENKTNGVKTWKAENTNTSTLFLYVLNNYWHTNYKAYQDGHFEFEVEIR